MLALTAAAQQRPQTEEVVGGVKRLEQSLGLAPNKNFERWSGEAAASYRCYFTGKLELPATYDQLQLRQGDERGCTVDAGKYDFFFYAIEAVGSGRSPVSQDLEAATLERVSMVVAHEDLHDAAQLKSLPEAIGEAATTLMGFHAAAEYARESFGGASEAYQKLAREAGLFLEKAGMVNRYWEQLSAVYAGVRAGKTQPAEALIMKAGAFARLKQECEGLRPQPSSFNACPAALNNAGLAFDATYTRYYPLVYELYRSLNQDFHATLEALGPAARGAAKSEREVARYLEELVARRRGY